MNNLVEIQGTEIALKEHRGQRVVTFKDIDMVHQRPEGTASRNFRENRQRFISGVDFYSINLTDNEIRRQFGTEKNAGRTVTAITESGYLMLVKSFTDDLAWKVQRELVDTYFKNRTKKEEKNKPEPEITNSTETYLEAARIMASVPDSQKYVINCLRHIVPDIDMGIKNATETKTKLSVMPQKEKPRYLKEGVDIDVNKLMVEIGSQRLTMELLAKKANVSVASVTNWVSGKHRPVIQNRTNLCYALGKDKEFLTPRNRAAN